MKIFYAVTSHLSYKLLQGQLAYFTNKSIEVIFCSSYNSDVEAAVKNEGALFCTLEMEREINLIKDLLSLIKAVRLLKIHNPDILNVSTPKASLIFVLAALINRKKAIVIHILRGLRSDSLSGWKRYLVSFTEKVMCNYADHVVSISPSLLEHARTRGILGRRQGHVLGYGSSNGVNLTRFELNEEKLSFLHDFKRKHKISTEVVFGYFGRMVNDKGIRELYGAFSEIRNSRGQVKLLLVGSIDENDGIDEALASKFLNDSDVIWVESSEKIEFYYAVIDVFVLYSYREGFGNVVIEAAAMGKPSIVADIPGLRDTVIAGRTGLCSEPRNQTALAGLMYLFSQDLKMRILMGERAKQRVIECFNREIVWGLWWSFYRSTLTKAIN